MFILGLTGTIGMGKTTVAGLFRARGVPVHNADEAVHKLYEGEGVAAIAAVFPQAIAGGKVDRQKLRLLLKNDADWRKLEATVHPLVHEEEKKLVAAARAAGHSLIVLDIPLLFETGGEKRCDAVAVASAPPDVQRARALSRPGMSGDKFDSILARQMPDAEKRRRAHIVIDTGGSLEDTARQVDAVIRMLAGR